MDTAAVTFRSEVFRQAKVGDLRFPRAGQQHVGRLQIAMDHPQPMRGMDGAGQLLDHLGCVARFLRPN